jgi:hypothetical protein
MVLFQYGIMEMIEEQDFRSVHGEMVQVWSPNRDGIGSSC